MCKMNNENTKPKQPRKKFSPEFKDQVLLRAEKDSVAIVAADLGLRESMIYSWRSKRKLGGTSLENQKIQIIFQFAKCVQCFRYHPVVIMIGKIASHQNDFLKTKN